MDGIAFKLGVCIFENMLFAMGNSAWSTVLCILPTECMLRMMGSTDAWKKTMDGNGIPNEPPVPPRGWLCDAHVVHIIVRPDHS